MKTLKAFQSAVERRLTSFNTKLESSIKTMGGDNTFYYPAGESTICGSTDPILPGSITKILEGDEDGHHYFKIEVRVDIETIALYHWDDDTTIDLSYLDESISYLKRRINRTLHLYSMDGDAIDKEINDELNDNL